MKNNTRGFTLIELIVAIGLFSILVAIAAGGFTNALRTQREVAGLIAAQSNAGLAIEQMAREARTGDEFCHTPTLPNTEPTTPGQVTCSCKFALVGSGPDSLWTCSDLDFDNADGEEVNYSLANGALMRTAADENGGAAQALTGNNVTLKYLTFTLFGNLEGDQWNPRITITMGVSPSSTDPAIASNVLSIQTTVSAREIDCGPPGVGC